MASRGEENRSPMGVAPLLTGPRLAGRGQGRMAFYEQLKGYSGGTVTIEGVSQLDRKPLMESGAPVRS